LERFALQRILSAYRHSVILLVAVGCIASFAQSPSLQPQVMGSPANNNPLQVQLIKTGLYLVSGGGANTLVRMSGNGLVLVDGKLPDSYPYLHGKLKRIDDQPVRAVILTNTDPDHTGTDAKFLEAGAHLIVNQDAGLPMAANDSPRPAGALPPIITFDREYTLKIGGIEAQLIHYGRAHTGGDTVVYFPNLKVVAIGDLYAAFPNPDYARGGSLVGWGQVLAEVMKLDFDVAIPSSGEPITRADLQAFQAKVDTLVSRATQLVKTGVPKDQFMTQLKTDDLVLHFDLNTNQIDSFYAELPH
jgi:cyclase